MNKKEERKEKLPKGKHSLTGNTTRVGATQKEEQTGGKKSYKGKVNTHQTREKE
jgi:hypothetical protein